MNDPHLLRLRERLRELGSVLVCYSGGVDSAFVLKVAHDVLGRHVIGMTAVGPSLANFEKEAAMEVARQIGARHELVESKEIDDPDYQANDVDRCFHCKSELYSISARMQREWGVAWVVNGTNLDDLGDFRPGLDAAKAAGVRSPLVEAGFTKADVRRCAELVGLSVWDKPAAACLASRLPYGTSVTRERLERIGRLEWDLQRLGLRQVRVRWHSLDSTAAGGDAPFMARIEVSREELPQAFEKRDAIVDAGKRLGFAYVTLDLQGYRTGSHNEVLQGRNLRVV